LLKPMNTWTRFHSKDALIEALDKALSGIPGIAYNFTQPMAMRIDETVSGVKADLAIKVFGDDFGTLEALGQRVRGAVDLDGELGDTANPQALPTFTLPTVQVIGDVTRRPRKTSFQHPGPHDGATPRVSRSDDMDPAEPVSTNAPALRFIVPPGNAGSPAARGRLVGRLRSDRRRPGEVPRGPGACLLARNRFVTGTVLLVWQD
jgi:hypothetical protein